MQSSCTQSRYDTLCPETYETTSENGSRSEKRVRIKLPPSVMRHSSDNPVSNEIAHAWTRDLEQMEERQQLYTIDAVKALDAHLTQVVADTLAMYDAALVGFITEYVHAEMMAVVDAHAEEMEKTVGEQNAFTLSEIAKIDEALRKYVDGAMGRVESFTMSVGQNDAKNTEQIEYQTKML